MFCTSLNVSRRTVGVFVYGSVITSSMLCLIFVRHEVARGVPVLREISLLIFW